MTLETAKQLKEAGWDKKTKNIFSNYFLLSYSGNRSQITSYGNRGSLKPCGMQLLDDKQSELLQKDAITDAMDFETYPCPSLEELLAVMPTGFHSKKGSWFNFTMHKYFDIDENPRYSLFYSNIVNEIMYDLTDSDPTEAVAQLWLKLRKEGIV